MNEITKEEYLAAYAKAVKFIQERYPEWNGCVNDGIHMTLTGCANMMADFLTRNGELHD